MRPKAFGIVHGDQDELAKQINQIAELARKGEAKCVAIRVYMVDGSYQDHVLTGEDDDEVRQQAINHLRTLANEGLSE